LFVDDAQRMRHHRIPFDKTNTSSVQHCSSRSRFNRFIGDVFTGNCLEHYLTCCLIDIRSFKCFSYVFVLLLSRLFDRLFSHTMKLFDGDIFLLMFISMIPTKRSARVTNRKYAFETLTYTMLVVCHGKGETNWPI
jgi:hypothetical protein